MSFLDDLGSSIYSKDFSPAKPKSKEPETASSPSPLKSAQSEDEAIAQLLSQVPDSLNDSFSKQTLSTGASIETPSSPPKELFSATEVEEAGGVSDRIQGFCIVFILDFSKMSFLDDLGSSIYSKDFSPAKPKSKEPETASSPSPLKSAQSEDEAIAQLLSQVPDSLNDSFSKQTLSTGASIETPSSPPKELFSATEDAWEDDEEVEADGADEPGPSAAPVVTDDDFIRAAWQREESLTLEQRRSRYRRKARELGTLPVWPDYAKAHNITDVEPDDSGEFFYAVDADLNRKIVLWQGDITTLEVDAVVNAANRSLLGGGGIDGAIHSAAGDELYDECKRLRGCETGSTKITRGYRLPAKYVLHTVGPTNGSAEHLESCYKSILQLVDQHGIRSVALCGVATGIYGFPLVPASRIALQTVRDWLQTGDNRHKVDAIVFCTFLDKELRCYEQLLPHYFPTDDKLQQRIAEAEAKAQQQLAEAEKRRREQEAEDARLQAEQARLAEEKRLADEKRVAEEKRIADEKRAAEERRAAEAKRVAEETRLAAEKLAAEQAAAKKASEPAPRATAAASGTASEPAPAASTNRIAIGVAVVAVAVVTAFVVLRKRL
eukprot:TRINITY_DN5037_c0_g1_i2.p1 TRINITY_DN5037_c0_g1~~TRINITY_DN5037_c0_g1_i2.p1  ORF type:complete len:638 (+),score=231.06 TRINITY_DN5037_c0_g1_i2:95-1915(+)